MKTFKNKIYYLLFVLLFSLLHTMTSFAAAMGLIKQAPVIQLVTGYYLDAHSGGPLILTSTDDGSTWSVNTKIDDQAKGGLDSVSCTDGTCVSGGSLDWSSPLLLSKDNGITWSLFKDINKLPKMISLSIDHVSCSRSTCLASGNYIEPITGYRKPLLLVSNDQAQSWTFNNYFNDAPHNFELINYASCSGGACVGIGGENTKERLMISLNSGYSWTFKPIMRLPEDSIGIKFNTAQCQQGLCIAGGSFDVQASPSSISSYPLLSISKDQGANWNYIKSIDLSSIEGGEIFAMAHAKNIWVAAGMFAKKRQTPEPPMTEPLLLVSTDQGNHWLFKNNIKGLPNGDTVITSISCQRDFCVAGGHYYIGDWRVTDRYVQPIFITSADRGRTWQAILEIKNLPTIKGAEIASVNCHRSNCIAVGHYHDRLSGDKHSYARPLPLLLTSSDKGKKWTFININKILPNIMGGELKGATSMNKTK
jgi:hypothetical protein